MDDWNAAAARASGYSDKNLLEEIKAAADYAVRNKAHGAVSRDGVVLHRILPPFPLLCALLKEALKHCGEITVLDFGGALGTSYFQCAPLLTAIKKLHWGIVEQPVLAAHGTANFANDNLKFFPSIDAYLGENKPDVVLFSSVLQYVPNPTMLLEQAADTAAGTIVIDRTPFVDTSKSQLSIQKASRGRRAWSLPVWLFSRTELLVPMLKNYRVVSDFPAIDGTTRHRLRRVEFRGLILERLAG